jgi:hypothetical protein
MKSFMVRIPPAYEAVRQTSSELGFAKFDGHDSFHLTLSFKTKQRDVTTVDAALRAFPDCGRGLMIFGLILAFLALVVVVWAVMMLWKRPSPNHEYMLDLYDRVLGQAPEQFESSFASRSVTLERRRAAYSRRALGWHLFRHEFLLRIHIDQTTGE